MYLVKHVEKRDEKSQKKGMSIDVVYYCNDNKQLHDDTKEKKRKGKGKG